MINYTKFVQSKIKDTSIYKEVDKTADLLFNYLSQPDIVESINEKNKPRVSSKEIQEVFIDYAQDELKFKSERTGLFDDYPTPGIRPDYYKNLKSDGIIIEVEKGKTIMNNMDLLDFWKCHICTNANHLFLLVPNEIAHNEQRSYPGYAKVISRLSPFFNDNNYTNVHGLTIYGY